MSESALHVKVAQYLDATIHPPLIWTTIDAGAGKMRPRTARQRKNRGVKRGWPDILILGPGPNLLGIELKTEDGEQSADQCAVELAFSKCAAWYSTCRSVQEVDRAVAFVFKKREAA